ncbi:MAG: HAMP domain-containing protein, partial [Trueperaceae bacterium]
MDQPSNQLGMSSLSTSSLRQVGEQSAGNSASFGDILEASLAKRKDQRSVGRSTVTFRDIPVGQKLGLIALSLFIPIAFLLYAFVSQVQQDTNFIVKEQKGLDYLRPLKSLQDAAHEYRVQTTNALQGLEGATAQQSASANQLDTALSQLLNVDEQQRLAPIISEEISLLQQKWTEIQAEVMALDPATAGERVGSMINENIVPLYLEIANGSNLILDNDPTSYYLINLIVKDIPSSISDIGAFRTLGRAVLSDGTVNASERIELVRSQVIAQRSAQAIFASLDQAKASSLLVAEQLGEAEARASDAINTVLESYATNIIDVAEPTYTFEEANTLPQPRRPTFELFDGAINTLDTLLETRIQDIQRSFLLVLAGVGASLLLAALITYFVTAQITQPLRELSQVSALVGQGNLSQLANVESKDEIGTLATSFNASILQLREANERQEAEIARGQQLQNNIGEFLNVAM